MQDNHRSSKNVRYITLTGATCNLLILGDKKTANRKQISGQPEADFRLGGKPEADFRFWFSYE